MKTTCELYWFRAGKFCDPLPDRKLVHSHNDRCNLLFWVSHISSRRNLSLASNLMVFIALDLFRFALVDFYQLSLVAVCQVSFALVSFIICAYRYMFCVGVFRFFVCLFVCLCLLRADITENTASCKKSVLGDRRSTTRRLKTILDNYIFCGAPPPNPSGTGGPPASINN